MPSSPRVPELSVILPTDTYETIKPVLEKLRQQTVANRIEVILVSTSPREIAKACEFNGEFAALQILETQTLSPLAIPRAIGVRAAAAALIFNGETHSYLHPDAAEKLIARAASGPWAIVVPGFENGNPTGVFSWAAFLGAYGRWSAVLPEGEINEAPLYDSLYRREVLLDLGERLVPMLEHGDHLRLEMQARGHRVYFEPAARIDHLNIEKPVAWLREHFLIGLAVSSRRAREWRWSRRLAYIAAGGLIPLVLFWRVWPGLRQTARAQQLPFLTFPTVALLFAVKAAGEMIGYAGGGGRSSQTAAMTHYEVRRIDYVS